MLLITALYGCSSDPWSNEEKQYFLLSCKEEGGRRGYCKCFLEKTMKAYPRFEDSQKMSFEEAVELSKNCK